MPRTILAFGYHKQEGARHSVLCEGFRAHGIEIIECHTKKKGILPKFRDLWKFYCKYYSQADAVLVTFPGHYIMPLAWLLTRFPRKPLLFDAFISQYDTLVQDRKLVHETSPNALALWWIDRMACKLADCVFLDTEQHKRYFVETFSIRPEKISIVPIGAKEDVFTPATPQSKHNPFQVVFHGSFIPLQGISTILDAAKLLEKEDIQFTIIGRGQTYNEEYAYAQSLGLTNVTFTGNLPMEEVAVKVQDADVCLGIFGTTDKASRVIPHKAYEILASAKPLITGDTPAARAYFTDQKNALLSAPGDPKSLVEKILLLREHDDLREHIAQEGRNLFVETCKPATIVTNAVSWLKEQWQKRSSSPASPASSEAI